MRKDWDSYFIGIAFEVASRATCPRGSVGAVFVKDRDVLATGYNGSVSGTEHCTELSPEEHVVNGHCDIVLHAEINAIIRAARKGVALEGSVLYCTHFPCWPCMKAVLNLGVTRIVYAVMYRPNQKGINLAGKKNVPLVYNPMSKEEPNATPDQDP